MPNERAEVTDIVMELIVELRGAKVENSGKDVPPPLMHEGGGREKLVRQVKGKSVVEKAAFIRNMGPDEYMDTIQRGRRR